MRLCLWWCRSDQLQWQWQEQEQWQEQWQENFVKCIFYHQKREGMMTGSFKDLKAFMLSYELAMEIFHLTKSFPKEEKYSLVDQIRRASRSVSANIAEGYRKRIYPKHFAMKMSDADGEASETQVWLDFAKDCGYIQAEIHQSLTKRYEEVGRLLGGMIRNPEKFLPK